MNSIIFFTYFQNGSETMDFREYLIGLSLVSQPVNNDDTIRLAFQVRCFEMMYECVFIFTIHSGETYCFCPVRLSQKFVC